MVVSLPLGIKHSLNIWKDLWQSQVSGLGLTETGSKLMTSLFLTIYEI